MPGFVEGLAHVQKDGDSLMIPVDGVSELCDNSDKLKSGRMLPAEAELFLPDEIIQQGSNPAMQEALEHLRYEMCIRDRRYDRIRCTNEAGRGEVASL